MRRAPVAIVVMLLGGAFPIRAQEWTVHHAVHTFISNHVAIEVVCDAPGTLRVAFGALGQITVTGRARHGVSESSLAGTASDRLVLAEIGADSVTFLVFVPEGVRTQVTLPGRSFPIAVAPGQSPTFSWPGRTRAPGAPGMSMDQASASPTQSLAERLGYSRSDKLLIINIDDVALSEAANAATADALEHGLPTSASIMVPAPWFPEIAAYARAHPQMDFGVHLTHTSEWRGYRWRPVSGACAVPGLVDGQGYLWSHVDSVYVHGTPEEAEHEARMQIEQARSAGIDVTHLDSHMDALLFDRRYLAVYVKLARDYDLPIRLPSQDWLRSHGYAQLREELAAQGIVSPDYLIPGGYPAGASIKSVWLHTFATLQPGVTEVYIHAALPSEEMRTITGEVPAGWRERAAEYELFTHDNDLRALLQHEGVRLIGYRALRDLQRRERADIANRTP